MAMRGCACSFFRGGVLFFFLSLSLLIAQVYVLNTFQIDSAISYRNEKGCAEGIRSSGFSREDVFLTTKIPPKQMGYEKTKAAIESSLKNAELDYFDL